MSSTIQTHLDKDQLPSPVSLSPASIPSAFGKSSFGMNAQANSSSSFATAASAQFQTPNSFGGDFANPSVVAGFGGGQTNGFGNNSTFGAASLNFSSSFNTPGGLSQGPGGFGTKTSTGFGGLASGSTPSTTSGPNNGFGANSGFGANNGFGSNSNSSFGNANAPSNGGFGSGFGSRNTTGNFGVGGNNLGGGFGSGVGGGFGTATTVAARTGPIIFGQQAPAQIRPVPLGPPATLSDISVPVTTLADAFSVKTQAKATPDSDDVWSLPEFEKGKLPFKAPPETVCSF
eukprot:Platyproteum_vivax@DN4809_c0_g1_i2.p1